MKKSNMPDELKRFDGPGDEDDETDKGSGADGDASESV